MLIATGAIKSDELESFDIKPRSADYWTECLLESHLTLGGALGASQTKDDEIPTRYILQLYLDERSFVKGKPKGRNTPAEQSSEKPPQQKVKQTKIIMHDDLDSK